MVDFKFKIGEEVILKEKAKKDWFVGKENKKASKFKVISQVITGKNNDKAYYVIGREGIAPRLTTEEKIASEKQITTVAYACFKVNRETGAVIKSVVKAKDFKKEDYDAYEEINEYAK